MFLFSVNTTRRLARCLNCVSATLWLYEPNTTLVHRFATLTKAETISCLISGFDFLNSLLTNLFIIHSKMTLLHVGAHPVFFHPTLFLKDFCQVPLHAGVFPGSRKVDWTLKIVHSWPLCGFPPLPECKSVLEKKKLDNDFRITVFIIERQWSLQDQHCLRNKNSTESHSGDKCLKLLLKYFFQKVIVWQWPNCGQYLHWCIVYSFFAHPSQYFEKCPSAWCFNWHYITLYMGVCTQI